jgi:hypothetical protein
MATIKGLLKAVFSVGSTPRLYNEETSQERTPHKNKTVTVKE